MNQDLIFFPMGALALITFAVLLMIPFRRFATGRSGLVTAEDFRFGDRRRRRTRSLFPTAT